jgi:hypothetical protein
MSLANASYQRTRVIDDQEHHRAGNRYEEAVKIQIRHTCVSEQVRDKASDNRPDNSQENVAVATVPSLVYEFAAEESRDHTQSDPADERKCRILAPIGKQKTHGGDFDDRHFVCSFSFRSSRRASRAKFAFELDLSEA